MSLKYVNPTGGKVRGTDPRGSGKYGAPRGERVHMGTDYLGIPGQTILAVISGFVTKLGYPYGDDLSFRYVRITAEDGTEASEFYVNPFEDIEPGVKVEAGQEIGNLQALHGRYKDIQNHCHVQFMVDGKFVDPEALIL